ncbi:MFS transporter [Salinispora fenicalii]|uniref:MFS transporter n=1 Tax=Salinispora fenicalii TaxID=1137263 RepID=UPI000486D8A5|nr:MFS transporter [Salinispora fenicalii]
MSPAQTAGHRRGLRVMAAAALARGPAEVLDFLLPLWAGTAIGATAGQIGALAATEALLSLLGRPAAGVLADRFDRARVAAAGAVLFGLSLFGYALATNLGVAFGAAVCGGVGGALFWVALRARVGEHLRDDAAIYSRLLSAEGTGIWIGFLVALTLLDNDRYQLVFGTAGVACLLAAVLLLSSPTPAGGPSRAQVDLRQVARRLRPLLVVVAVTATVEFGVSLLLLLHLQRGFGLTVGQISLVFLPGFVILTALPLRLHAVVRRIGRAATLTSSLIASAIVAVGLAFAANPVAIGALWAVSAACLAAAIPVEQTIAAEASDGSLGRGMGIYQSATLLGAVLGPLSAGALYQSGGWRGACVGAAGVLVAGAALVPAALRRVGVPDRPPPQPSGAADLVATPAAETVPPAPPPQRRHSPVELRRRWTVRSAVFIAGQVAFAALGHSWLAAVASGRYTLLEALNGDLGDASWQLGASRIWLIIFLVDSIWTWARLLRSRRRHGRESQPG